MPQVISYLPTPVGLHKAACFRARSRRTASLWQASTIDFVCLAFCSANWNSFNVLVVCKSWWAVSFCKTWFCSYINVCSLAHGNPTRATTLATLCKNVSECSWQSLDISDADWCVADNNSVWKWQSVPRSIAAETVDASNNSSWLFSSSIFGSRSFENGWLGRGLLVIVERNKRATSSTKRRTASFRCSFISLLLLLFSGIDFDSSLFSHV